MLYLKKIKNMSKESEVHQSMRGKKRILQLCTAFFPRPCRRSAPMLPPLRFKPASPRLPSSPWAAEPAWAAVNHLCRACCQTGRRRSRRSRVAGGRRGESGRPRNPVERGPMPPAVTSPPLKRHAAVVRRGAN